MDWIELVYYDESSLTCLRWKEVAVTGRGARRSARQHGDVAGTLNSNGYYVVNRGASRKLVHHLILELEGSVIPRNKEVDHENRIRTDNRRTNLRVVPRVVNARNHTRNSNNRTGITGVHLDENTRGAATYLNYVATWFDEDGRKRSAKFSCRKYGKEGAMNLAVRRREEEIAKLKHYTPTHGKEQYDALPDHSAVA